MSWRENGEDANMSNWLAFFLFFSSLLPLLLTSLFFSFLNPDTSLLLLLLPSSSSSRPRRPLHGQVRRRRGTHPHRPRRPGPPRRQGRRLARRRRRRLRNRLTHLLRGLPQRPEPVQGARDRGQAPVEGALDDLRLQGRARGLFQVRLPRVAARPLSTASSRF